MNVTGVIAEYNPFHSGHAYHLKKTRELTRADYVLVIMGGNFMQRGEPAIVDKYMRTRMALLGGADLVAELPSPFAVGSAEYFADGAIDLLTKCGVVNALSFGSEEGALPLLDQAASVLLDEPEKFRNVLKMKLKNGVSFPSAREAALGAVLSMDEKHSSALFSSPNNILGIEYLKALKKRQSPIQPYTISRRGNYHGTFTEGTDTFASASFIREQLLKLRRIYEKDEILPQLSKQLPCHSYEMLSNPLIFDSFATLEDFAPLLHYRLLAARAPLEFAVYLDVTEDLSRRIFSLRNEFCGYENFLNRLRTRQYTRTRIARSLLHILLDIRKDDIALPSVLRILGFRREAAPLLTELKKKSSIPLITKIAGHKELEKEIAVSTLYHIGKPYQEATQQLVIV